MTTGPINPVSEIRTIPKIVNVTHYSGDTLTISVTAPASIVDGLDWDAQVRPSRDSATIDGTFTVIPPQVPDGVAYLILPAAVTSSLAESAPVTQVRNVRGELRSIQRYTGVWDVQVSEGGSDPVTTLAQGSMTIEIDVTRLVAP